MPAIWIYEVTSTLNYFHLILTLVFNGIYFLSLVDFLKLNKIE